MNISEFPITAGLIAANVIYSLIGFSNESFMEKSIMWPYGVLRNKQYYRFITSGFLHGDYLHLFFNMFTLYFFGRAVELYFSGYGLGGNISYLVLYFAALIISDIPTFIKYKNAYHYRSLGASGAVSAVVFAAIVFNPWGTIYLYGKLGISSLLYAVLYIFYCIYMGKRNQDNINHDAHLWGALFGFAFTVSLIAALQPALFDQIIELLKHPSIFGNDPG